MGPFKFNVGRFNCHFKISICISLFYFETLKETERKLFHQCPLKIRSTPTRKFTHLGFHPPHLLPHTHPDGYPIIASLWMAYSLHSLLKVRLSFVFSVSKEHKPYPPYPFPTDRQSYKKYTVHHYDMYAQYNLSS